MRRNRRICQLIRWAPFEIDAKIIRSNPTVLGVPTQIKMNASEALSRGKKYEEQQLTNWTGLH